MASNDMKSANATYDSFIATLKWAVPLLAVLTAIIVVVIAG